MRRSRVFNFRGLHKFLEFVVYNKMLIILSLFFLTGLIIGVFYYGNSKTVDAFIKENFSVFLNERASYKFAKILLDCFFGYMLYLVFGFVLGASMLGSIFLPLFLSFKGILYGLTAALLYSEYSLKGIAFYTLLILPSAVIFSVLLIFAVSESMRFSLLLVRSSLVKSNNDLSFDFKNFCIKYLSFVLGVFLCALVDSFLSLKLINSFSL